MTSLITAAVPDFQWFKYTGTTTPGLKSRKGKIIKLHRGDVFGARLSTNKQFIRVSIDGSEFTVTQELANFLAANCKPSKAPEYLKLEEATAYSDYPEASKVASALSKATGTRVQAEHYIQWMEGSDTKGIRLFDKAVLTCLGRQAYSKGQQVARLPDLLLYVLKLGPAVSGGVNLKNLWAELKPNH